MRNPNVSIIVPVYNVELHLDRCIDSLVNQTLRDIEIILVDDKSPDNCPQICDSWAQKDCRIKVKHKQYNEGLGFARNSGTEIASGKYVTFIDSDDYLELDALEKLYNIAESKNLDVCYGSFCYDKTDGNKFCKYEVENDSVCKAIFRHEVFQKHNLRFSNEKKIASEDFLFHLNLLSKVDRIGFLPMCYYHYCENGESISHTYTDAKFERIRLSMIEVKKLLSGLFPFDKYILHYQRCLFLSLRGVLAHEYERQDVGFFKKLSLFSERCGNGAYKDLFSHYPYWKLSKAKAILYLGMKYRLSLLMYIIFLFKAKLDK